MARELPEAQLVCRPSSPCLFQDRGLQTLTNFLSRPLCWGILARARPLDYQTTLGTFRSQAQERAGLERTEVGKHGRGSGCRYQVSQQQAVRGAIVPLVCVIRGRLP